MSDAPDPQTGPEVASSITEREARAAVVVLQEVASRYNGFITYADLKDQVAGLTRRPTNQMTNSWADRVLARVIEICERDGHPRLTALVVRGSDGGVGNGFKAALLGSGRDRIDDPELLEIVAAEERLNCYRQYCPDLPDEAEPTLTREYKAHISRRTKPEPRERPVCGACGYEMPATGRCGYCD
ncbi:hypothetical protein D6T65_02355 [Arthrobacter frigidicola]|nr:hypothetical protein D6T65_02355 [Arthrobacter frigidicola]